MTKKGENEPLGEHIGDPDELIFTHYQSRGVGDLYGADVTDTIPTGAFRDLTRGPEPYSQMEPYVVSSYELDGAKMMIRDTLWGDLKIDGSKKKSFDALLMRLARTPLLRRTQAIEQLTLGNKFATMPSSAYFSRWSHIWGSLVFVRKMNEGRDISPHENQTMQLRTLLSDVGHTAFSHLGDWMFQTDGPSEDLHDKELKDILAVSGVADLLDEYGFTLDETVFPEIEDWVESPAPDLCVDRVDYGLREMTRWQSSFTHLGQYGAQLKDPQSLFAIVEGKLTIKDPEFANRFAVGYSLLPTEHYAHPVHNLQLQLFQTAMRRVLVSTSSGHPRETLYGVDANFDRELLSLDTMAIVEMMKSVAISQRRIFKEGRIHDLNDRFANLRDSNRRRASDYVFPQFPDPMQMDTWQSREFWVPHAPNLIVESVSPADAIMVNPLEMTKQGLRFALPKLKPRAVDPHLLTEEGEQVRLGEYNATYHEYLRGQRAEMTKNYLVTMLMNPVFAQQFVERSEATKKIWDEIVKLPRSKEALISRINAAEGWGAAMRFDDISEW